CSPIQPSWLIGQMAAAHAGASEALEGHPGQDGLEVCIIRTRPIVRLRQKRNRHRTSRFTQGFRAKQPEVEGRSWIDADPYCVLRKEKPGHTRSQPGLCRRCAGTTWRLLA